MADPVSPAQLVDAVNRFGQERERLRCAAARAMGLATADLDALGYLQSEGAMSQRDLGARLLLTSGAVTTLVDRLERAGWVRRRPNPADRRSVLVELVEDGCQEAAPLAEYRSAIALAAESLPAPGRAEMARMLEDIGAAAARAVEALDDMRPRARR